jgi:hypothetical protein
MTPPAVPDWFTVSQPIALLAIAILGAAIAYRQWRTARDKLRLDLFDRRMAVYSAAKTFLNVALIRRPETRDLLAFSRAKDEAMFLFGRGRTIP